MHATTPATHKLLRSLAAMIFISSFLIGTSATHTELTPQFLQAVGDYGPWKEPRAEFNAFLANSPSITGHYNIPGPNISASANSSRSVTEAPIGGWATIGGWSWSIHVAADLPLEHSKLNLDFSQGPLYYAGLRLALNAPSSLVGNEGNLTVDDDWQMCVYQWSLRNVSYPRQLRTDDGTCGSVLSDQCIADIENAAAPMIQENCRCPVLSTIPSCRDHADGINVFDSECSASFFNASRIRGSEWEDGKLEIWGLGDDATHHAGNDTAYNRIGSLSWPAMVGFSNGQHWTASLACVRATDTIPGTKVPIDESSGNSLGCSWAQTGLAVLVFMLIL
ncbi:hypothetical protein F5Y03DRAFT_377604 [Xylaria venustula]|nr:hypothetical protein F5Y03DRAFT_377604 [Xylaria venustula]